MSPVKSIVEPESGAPADTTVGTSAEARTRPESTAELTRRYVLGNYGRFDLAFSRGEGGFLWDESGRRYLDFATGIAVCSLGHCPAVLREAVESQVARLVHCSNLYQIREQAELARFVVERIVRLPGKAFFCNSGAEANDTLIKLARKRAHDRFGAEAGKNEVVTCRASFHGRTLGGIAATGQEKVKVGFDPLLPGFAHVPFNDPETLALAVSDRTAAILFEPVQGEGGIHVATPEFIAAADALRRKHDLLLMFDEVQCGSGRTGDWCGWRTVLRDSGLEIEPDAVSWAKGFGGGFPVGAVWIDDRHIDALGPGTHGSTFGGTPLASAAALAVLEEIERSGALANVVRQEQRIRDAVAAWDFPQLAGLRGLGLMLGFVLREEAFGGLAGYDPPSSTPAAHLVRAAMDRGLLTVPAGANVVRWLPRLDVPDAEVDEALAIFAKTFESLQNPAR